MINRRPLNTDHRALFLPFVFLLLTLTAFGQSSTATLSGTVEDQNGQVIPNATVTISDLAKGLERKAVTNSSGGFTFALLPASTYNVLVESAGFATVRLTDIVLNVGDQKAVQVALKVGDVNAAIEVRPDASLIDESPAVATVVDREFVENLPLNGRSFQSLITLTPGVVTVPSGSTNATGQFSINGQRASANSFIVDGVSANFGAAPNTLPGLQTSGNLPALTTSGTTQSLVSVDALQEFTVQTSSYSAEFGRQPGGQISIVTRSGGNDFHGSLFNYLRNEVFDANDWFANRAGQPRPPLRQNDFGGTFSGPLFLPRFGEGGNSWHSGKDRTFFFFSYEGLRLRLPKFALTNVPTLVFRQTAPSGVQPILNAFPLPNGRDLGNGLAEFVTTYSDSADLNATSLRIDHAFNKLLTLFARVNYAPSDDITRVPVNLSNLSTNKLKTQTLTFGATISPKSHIANDFRVNYSNNEAIAKLSQDSFNGAIPVPRAALIPSQYDSSSAQGAVSLLFPGNTSTSTPQVAITGDFLTSQRQFNLVNNFSYNNGSHQLKFGLDYRRLSPVSDLNSYLLSSFFFSNQQVLNSTAAFAVVVNFALAKPIYINFSAYGTDTWKLSKRFTLSFGLRWEVNPAPRETLGNNPLALTTVDNLSAAQLAPSGTSLWRTTYSNFAPRIGVAYNLSQVPGRETVVRGGFGVYYDTGNDLGSTVFSGFPFVRNRFVPNLTYPLSPLQTAPPPSPSLTPPYPSFSAFDPALKLPYTLQWNVAVEQSLGKNQTATVSYVAAAGRKLLQRRLLSLTSINPNFTLLNLTTNSASSDYHALQAQFQRRLSRGLQALVSYTWSHAIDDDSESSGVALPQRGNASFDLRHNFAAAFTYDIPRPSVNRVANVITRGWSIDTTINWRSALPVDLIANSTFSPGDGSLIFIRPNVNPGVPLYTDDPSSPGGGESMRRRFRFLLMGTPETLDVIRCEGFQCGRSIWYYDDNSNSGRGSVCKSEQKHSIFSIIQTLGLFRQR